jgi:transcriptional regulator with XRE-family HTH domain
MEQPLSILLKVLAQNIKKRRKELGYSQEHLAELAGMSHNFLARIEIASNSPSLSTLVHIAEALGMSVSELLSEQGSHPLGADERISVLLQNLGQEDSEFLVKETADWAYHLRKKC